MWRKTKLFRQIKLLSQNNTFSQWLLKMKPNGPPVGLCCSLGTCSDRKCRLSLPGVSKGTRRPLQSQKTERLRRSPHRGTGPPLSPRHKAEPWSAPVAIYDGKRSLISLVFCLHLKKNTGRVKISLTEFKTRNHRPVWKRLENIYRD